MSFSTPLPAAAADFESALRFIFGAWAALPPAAWDGPPDDADLELYEAFTRWLAAKEAASA